MNGFLFYLLYRITSPDSTMRNHKNYIFSLIFMNTTEQVHSELFYDIIELIKEVANAITNVH